MPKALINKTTKFILVAACLLISLPAAAVRVKDLAFIKGGRQNQLLGFSLVVGLNGTGDTEANLVSRRPLIDALERVGIVLNQADVVGRSIAAVIVTATLPPFAKQGSKVDVVVSAIGNAITLQGGVLLMTPLRTASREVFAVAQGQVQDIPRGLELPGAAELTGNQPLALNPFQNYSATVGRIIEGASIEKEQELSLNLKTRIYLSLISPDFTTAFRIARAINAEFGNNIAKAEDAGAIEISIPPTYLSQTVELISKIENIEVLAGESAKVVIDERSGTVIIGENVIINPVAISHSNINLLIRDEGIYPKTAFTPRQLENEINPPAQQNQAGADQDLSILPVPVYEKDHSVLLAGGTNLKEIVDALNKVGATNQEVIDIIKNLKAAGAMTAELIIR